MTNYTLNKTERKNLNIEVFPIDNKICLFKATLDVEDSLNKKITHTSEGITTLDSLSYSYEHSILPKPNRNYILKNIQFLDNIKKFGFPELIFDQTIFSNGDSDKISGQKSVFNLLIDSFQIKFSDSLDGHFLNSFLFIDFKNQVIFDYSTGKVVNMAFRTEFLNLSGANYHKFNTIIDQFENEKRITYFEKGASTFESAFSSIFSNNTEKVNALISLRDDEFEKAIKNAPTLDNYKKTDFINSILKSDCLNIAKYEKSDDDKKKDNEELENKNIPF